MLGVSLFVFAYGSLIFRPSRFFGKGRPALVRGYRRAFRQASPDHRGTPDFPGRVVTLLRDAGASCGGMLYEVVEEHVEAALIELDDRESGGYDRLEVVAEVRGEVAPRAAVTWVAHPENRNHLPPASPSQIAAIVRRARGKSGPNVEYVLRLAEALRALDWPDAEVHELEAALLAGSDAQGEAPATS